MPTKTTNKKTTTSTPKVETEVKVEEKPVAKVVEKKTFASDDMIQCRSITNGELLVVGDKSGILYKFADYNDETGIEYQDLLYAVRSRSNIITRPRLIVLDQDFIDQNKELDKIYSDMYTVSDLRDIMNMSAAQIREVVLQLPAGAKDALKGLIATGINDGTFDSVGKVRVFDELFGTKMLLTLTEN